MKTSAKALVLSIFVAASFALAAGGAHPAVAQEAKYGQAGMTFLKIGVNPRSAGLGGTWASTTGTAQDLFTNPAGLSAVEGVDVASSTNSWIVDTRQYGLGAAVRAGAVGTFGVSILWMDYGTMRRTVPYEGADPELRNQGYIDQGSFSVSEYAVGLAYSREITERFSIGSHLRYAKQDLGGVPIINELTGESVDSENAASNLTLDFGTLYYTGFRDLRFGVTLTNFSNQSDYYDQRFELPLSFDFGLAMDLLSLQTPDPAQRNSKLTLALNWLHPRDYSERLHTGLEYGFMDTVFLRAGYRYNYDIERFNAGVGFQTDLGDYLGLRADYAYSTTGKLFGAVHRLSVGFSL